MAMKTLILSLIFVIFINMVNTISALIYDGISEYHVIEGDSISLPCNITKQEWNQNLISLIVWYRSKNQGIPIYSIDTRTQQQRLRHQIMPELNGRVHMDFQTDPPVLNINDVQIDDGGDYRCRVDYRMNRTKHFLIHLNVSAIPKNVTIRDLLGNKVQGLIRKPYNEGDKVILFCDAIGGSPPPVVIWKNNDGKIIDDSYEFFNTNDDNHTRNRLEIPQIDRNYLLKEIICEAYPPSFILTPSSSTINTSFELKTVSDFATDIIDATTTITTTATTTMTTSKSYVSHNTILDLSNRINDNRNHNRHIHHHSFIRRATIVLDLNLRPLSVQIQVPANFQANLNRSSLPGTSLSSPSSLYVSLPSGFVLPSSSSSSSLSAIGTITTTSTTFGNVLVLSAGKKTEIECRTWGSRPPAEITWWRGSRRLPTAASRLHFTNGNGNTVVSSSSFSSDLYATELPTTSSEIQTSANLSISILTYIAAPEDDGQRLTCRADNLHLEHEEIEDSVIISVRYAPQLTLSLGAKIPENIREGSDVYFECASKSNPPLSEVVWLFEGKPLTNDPVSGVLVTNQSLVMQRVRREHRGNYQCAASNPEGISASNKVFLNVHFAPLCKPTQTIIYGVARTEQIHVSCEVEAEPVTPIQFRWFFNNSLESYELSRKDYSLEILAPNSSIEKSKKFFNNPHILSQLSLENVFSTIASMNHHEEPSVARSNATYSPRSRIGYGLLYCMAENSVGNQRDPCIFKIVEAGPPNSVHDCRIVNVTMASFILECVPGENGGLRQIFHLEVYNIEKEHLQVNVTAREEPVFAVENLPHDTAFMLNVFSSNAKGRSDSVTLRTATSAYAAKHTTNGKKQRAIILDDINHLIINPIFGALIVALISLVLLCLATMVFIRSRFCSNAHQSSSSSDHRRDTKHSANNNGESSDSKKICTSHKHKDNEKFVSLSHSPTLPSTSMNQFLISSPYSSESPMNQTATFFEYQTHGMNGSNVNLQESNSTPMAEISSVINKPQSNPYYMTTSANTEFIPQSLIHNPRYSTGSSDLMTNAFTYNVATTGTNAIYPIANDIVKISSITCPYNQTITTASRRVPLLRPIAIESISSSTSDRTIDDEWTHSKNDNTLIQSTNSIIVQRNTPQLAQFTVPP
ncbi:hypothetical protein HUG17_5167 [Dermatophagoides farinae]|uniref:Ig-like domain-containing protein n=1 Tax=Dermatophagoides farinae TaxID=6954 RepID=A0A9D4P173_DERFA|nr:hypothetical protein HUG17_5167 [Dermatophagoides farinae]